MKQFLYGLLAILLSHAGIAQDAASLSHATSTCNFNLNTHDVWASTCNPAGINNIKKINFGAFFQNHFLLKDVSSQYACIAFSVNKNICVGNNIFRFGNTLFSKNEWGSLMSLKLNAKIYLGAQLHVQFIHQSEEKERWTAFPEIGMTYKVNDKLHLASSLQKQLLRMGLTYCFDKKVQTNIQCIFNREKYPTIAAALDYQLSEKIIFKFNISNGAQPFHFGLAYQLKSIHVAINFSYHQQLGFSPSSSFTL